LIRWRPSSTPSKIASTTSTSKKALATSMANRASSAHTSTSVTPAAAGTLSSPGRGEQMQRGPVLPSTQPHKLQRQLPSPVEWGRHRQSIANTVPLTPVPSCVVTTPPPPMSAIDAAFSRD
jgi:hypothetical protein